MQSGIYLRKFPRGFASRGWDPQNPTTLTLALPVHKINGEAEDVKQGMVMGLAADGLSWTKGVQVQNPTTIAFAHQDAEDFDVVDSNKITALELDGQYRLVTPYFVRFETTGADATLDIGDPYSYTPGTLLTYAAADEIAPRYVLDETGTWQKVFESAAGYVRPAATGELIIGRVVAQPEGMMPLGVNGDTPVGYMPTGGSVYAGQQSIITAVDSTAEVDGSYFIEYDAKFHPGVKA